MQRTFPAIVLGGLLLSLAFAPIVSAHGAPPPASYEVRLLHDHNDDSAVMLQGKHGFDAIALDVREAYLPGLGDLLVAKLVLNGGCKPTEPSAPDAENPFGIIGYDPIAAQSECGELTMRVSFDTNLTTHSFDYVTADGGGNWTGDAALYRGPFDLNDGTRFAVEAWVPFTDYNLTAGMSLGNWFVEGFWGESATDHMPAGLDNSRGTDDATGPIATAFDYGDYVLRAPDYYVSAAVSNGDLRIEPGAMTTNFTVTVQNLLAEPQAVQASVSGPEGLMFTFGDSMIATADLDANGTASFEVTVDASNLEGSTHGPVGVSVMSNLGGHSQVAAHIVAEAEIGDIYVESPDLATGEWFEYVFEAAGTFHYHSHHASDVTGMVTILGHDDMEGMEMAPTTHDVHYIEDAQHGAAFDPAELTIHVGDTVRWINDHDDTLMLMGTTGEMDHTAHPHPEHGEDEESPGAPLVALLAAIAAIVITVRRRS